ncbi:hypothetical protein LCGC14_1258800 [marine sediment metagenome]|uniref:Uncharacterized protein n=1 Tax=marine sediment metagenome TaxID=412755 RepID=A0A0F9NI00_9ZZZZ
MERSSNSGMQDTGNPVLDSVVNALRGVEDLKPHDITGIHQAILQVAQKEPGGLERRPGGNQVRLSDSVYDSEIQKAAR